MVKNFTLVIALLIASLQCLAQNPREVFARLDGHRDASQRYYTDDSISFHYNAQHIIDTSKTWSNSGVPGIYTLKRMSCARYSVNMDTLVTNFYDNNNIISQGWVQIFANGDLQYFIVKLYTSNTLTSETKHTYMYNSNQKLTLEVIEEKDILTGLYANTSNIYRTYTNVNHTSYRDSATTFIFSNWENSELDIYTSISTNAYTVEKKSWDRNIHQYENIAFHTYHTDNAGVDTMLISQEWNGSTYVNHLKICPITHNSSGQVEIYETQTWDASSNQFDYKIGNRFQRYVYYLFPLNIHTSESDVKQLRIYPQPATNNITIDYPITGYHTIVLSDMTGKMVVQDHRNFKGGVELLDVHNVPAGNYIISIQGNETARQKISIAK